MPNRATKLMVIGVDAPIASRAYQWAKEGKLPTLDKLMQNGVYAANCLVPFPTITPPNWTAIVTGAWTGTHGITDFNIHNSGDPLLLTHQGFYSADCQAEYLWNAAEKEGKRSIVVNWPSTWPSTLKNGVQLGGGGLSIDDWRMEVTDPKTGDSALYRCSLADDQVFATEEYPFSNPVALRPASGWQDAGRISHALEAELKLAFRNCKVPVTDTKVWHLLVQDTQGTGYDRVVLSKTKNMADAFATLSVGQWSGLLTDDFQTAEGPKRASYKCKLMELSGDGKAFRLYLTTLCARDGFSHPEAVAQELPWDEGLPCPRGAMFAWTLGWIDADTCLERIDAEQMWLANVSTWLLKNKEWDLFFTHYHCVDWAYHTFGRDIDPLTAEDKERLADCQKVEFGMYESFDRAVGRLLTCADDNTLVLIVSDHGAKATSHPFSVRQVLMDAGFTVYKEAPEDTSVEPFRRPEFRREVDWAKTKAIAQRACYIYVNLRGRDPEGIVEPGTEYEAVRDQIIKALYNYTDPRTGKKPILFALRKEDARVLGLYGDRVGDIVYALQADYGGQHGNVLTTAEYGLGSLKGIFIMSGSGVKKGYELERNVWLVDYVPTICHLMELPLPRNTEGAILYQALEDPDARRKELQNLRVNYSRLQRAMDAERALTHTYNV